MKPSCSLKVIDCNFDGEWNVQSSGDYKDSQKKEKRACSFLLFCFLEKGVMRKLATSSCLLAFPGRISFFFILDLFLIHVSSFQSQALFSAMRRCTACSTQQQQADLAEGEEVGAFFLKAMNTTVQILNSGLENHTIKSLKYSISPCSCSFKHTHSRRSIQKMKPLIIRFFMFWLYIVLIL